MSGTTDPYRGYRGPTRALMQRFDITVWCEVRARTTRGVFEGLLLPRSETSDELHLVLKLGVGYNVGIRHDTVLELERIGYREAHYKIPEKEFPFDPTHPRVKLFGTGGTIASRLDYRTGAVIPAFSPGELYGSVPELADICNLETEKLFGVFSENMGPEQYLILAERIGEAIRAGYDGIVVGHGTDTMHHTAAALSFMVQRPPVPVIMVGSQRSSDRPSSDAAQNLINATWTAAHGPIAEVLVCMFGPTSDRYNLLHRGTRVRKMHSSYRSTFRTLGDIPAAMVEDGIITPLKDDLLPRRADREVLVQATYEERVTLTYYYPGMHPDVIDALVDRGYKGIVIAGTGLGHVNRKIYPALQRARDAGVQMYMTLQTLWGFVQMHVYETGREILGLGVIPLANMLPEVAFIKLGWALGLHPDDPAAAQRVMTTTIADEMTDREPHDGYLIYQGGVPEIREFLGKVWR
ncbi:MAG: Glu-tRNA(Gln) amidotransferase subunit GatD [Gemmatimonadota bacterium]|nr:Glu-tRNA(Gln) amidotransferase subunit GatD [Gemmatimonadota bacterium]MDH3366883.1 Glu-tRNA(Gln) amidotransferase subunit GatD [Gemmatimonadota bacterium]MDH3477880.1 Glu-tRNA(Gln) amidotransferase subunit GatD [Gemmatimonadota bacterium]MDH3568674.1 Glu-tRNA(Gln) amidotransferase subunit GatD [Gemmatimonadota bacterium]MDH5549560.1 Glu-tRNA(Gln) amidotransferase subunit GatD [Gemmatimonadota bacterium]